MESSERFGNKQADQNITKNSIKWQEYITKMSKQFILHTEKNVISIIQN